MLNNRPSVYVNITAWGIVKIALVLVGFYLLFLTREILVILFIALIISSALEPYILWMQNRKIPRSISILIVYVVLFLLASTVVYLIIPPIVTQFRDLSSSLPVYWEKVTYGLDYLENYSSKYGISESLGKSLESAGNTFDNLGGGVVNAITGIFGGIASFALVLVISFYIMAEENAIKKLVWSVVPEKHQVYVLTLVSRMQHKVGLWLRGQIMLSFIIFLMTYIGLSILHIKYALVLALIAGITETIPYLGPTLAAIPAVLLAFTQSPMLALFVGILYYIIQFTENHIIVPKLMQKVVGLNPVVIICALLAGFKLAGVAGAIIAIPLATAVSVFIKDIFEVKPSENTPLE